MATYGSIKKLFICGVIASFMAGAASAKDIDLNMVAGSVGGGYFKAAAAFSKYVTDEMPNVKITVRPGTTWANVDQLDAGTADLATVENVLSTLSWKGDTPSGHKYNFRMLAAVRGPSVIQAFVPVNRGITSFEQIAKEKKPVRIATFQKSQLVTPIALDALAQYGITPQKLQSWGGSIIYTSLRQGFQMLSDGTADIWITGGSYYPHTAAIELGAKEKYRLLPLSGKVAKAVADKYGMKIVEVPANVYAKYNGEDVAYKSPALIVCFAVRTDMSDDMAYNILDALWKHRKAFHALNSQHRVFNIDFAQSNVGQTPLHPGAMRWYEEHKKK